MAQVLITGGSGLIGRWLTKLLLQEGYEVRHLSRSNKSDQGVRVFEWNPEEKQLPPEAITGSSHIIHLAGASIAKRWTARYRKQLYTSRIATARLLYDVLVQTGHRLETFLSASAVGIYGNRGDVWLNEEDQGGQGFLPGLCREWEGAALPFEQSGCRVVILRTGLVLDTEGGLLPELLRPMRLGLATVFGSGKQYYPWIHTEDVCRLYLHLLQQPEASGIFNATAPHPLPMRNLVREVVSASRKNVLTVSVPRLPLQLMLGGFAGSLFDSQRCSAQRVMHTGFRYRYEKLPEALHELLHRR